MTDIHVTRDSGPLGPTRLDLIARARDGDSGAFAELVRELQPRVFRWALAIARDPDEAEDITQEAFVIMYRRLGQFRGDAPLESWLYRITRRAAFEISRDARKRVRLDHSLRALPERLAYHTDPGARVDRERAAALIRELFTLLPARQREVFDLVDLQGYDPSEVAVMIGGKAVSIRANLFKARATMRARLLAAHPRILEMSRP